MTRPMKIIRSALFIATLFCGLGSSVSYAQTHEETALWDSVKDSKDAEDYKAYLDKYPDGIYAPVAKRRVAEFDAHVPAPAPAMPREAKGELAAPEGTKRAAGTPVTMTECEGTNNCATWTFLGSQGNGQWPSGETANLTVDRFDADSVVIRRADSTGPSAGLTALYRGTRHGDRIGGEFTATRPGQAEPVTGNWYATIGRVAQALPGLIHMCIRCDAGMGGTLTWGDGHYTNVAAPAGQSETYSVESFTRDSVVLHRTDHGPHEGEAILTGRLSGQGDSIVDGIQRWVGTSDPGHAFRAAWGDALNTVPGSRRPDPVMIIRPVACFPWFFTIVCG